LAGSAKPRTSSMSFLNSSKASYVTGEVLSVDGDSAL
jgi:hypothetical protein